MGCMQWKSSIQRETSIKSQQGGCCSQSHQQASAFAFQEVSLLPLFFLLGFAPGKLPRKLEWGWFVLVWIIKGKMCSLSQEVTHQDPCSRKQIRAGPNTQSHHMKQEIRSKKRAKTGQTQQ